MKAMLFFLAVLTPFSASARLPAKGQEVHILQMDPNFPIEDLEGEGRDLHPISEVGQDSESLPPSVQARFFRQAGLEPALKGWSGFDLDRLALRCLNQPAKEVAERYEGKIPVEAIMRFQALAKRYQAGLVKK